MRELEISTQTIGEIVAMDYRTASVFREAGIDFCCGGKKSLEATCSEKGIDRQALVEKLENVKQETGSITHNFREWAPGFLCDYIVNVHHTYVKKSLPELIQYTKKIARVHGENHPELTEVEVLFSGVNDELLQHMKREEEVLFPAIKEMFSTGSVKAAGIISEEISKYSEEHEVAGAALDTINRITSGYRLPADACNTYRISFELLQKFEDDLHTHIHLENNILFPVSVSKAAGER